MDLRTEIEIEASPAEVWEVLADLRAYPSWNPYVASAGGKLMLGAELRVILSLFDGSETQMRPRITVLSPERELRWKASRWLASLLSIEHRFLLEPAGDGRTRLVHSQTITGRLLASLGPDVSLTMRGMVQMNAALKVRVEQGTDT